jgi:hypothetical protein
MLVVALFASVYAYAQSSGETFWSQLGFLILAWVIGLAGGAIVGVVVGYVIWKATCRSGKQLVPGVRFMIGAGCYFGYLLLSDLITQRSSPLALNLTFDLVIAILVGGLAGLMAKSKAPEVVASTKLPETAMPPA